MVPLILQAITQVHFDAEKNVKWKFDLLGPSAATPIIYGNNVFISSIQN